LSNNGLTIVQKSCNTRSTIV